MADTSYTVSVDYRLAGIEKALAGTKGLSGEADKLARSLQWVKRAAMAVGASFVFGKVKSALIDSNRELESMQIGMSAVLGMSLSMPFEKAEPVAARLVEHYRQIAKVSPGTTKDFLEFNNAISGAVLNAGGSLGDLKKITAGGVIGGQAFGFRADVAAKDVQQALTGNVTMQTPFIKMLLGNESDIAKFNAMTGPARVAKLKEILEGPALKKAAQKFGESYEGQLSTLKDTAQNTFRAIGAPLFRQLTSWLKQINAWSDRNAAKLSAMATTVGNALTTGAQWLVKAIGYLVDNRGLLLTMGAAYGVGKVGFGIAAGMKKGADGQSAIGKFFTAANTFSLAVGAFALAAPLLGKLLDKIGGESSATTMMRTYDKRTEGVRMGIRQDADKSGFGRTGYAVNAAENRQYVGALGSEMAIRFGRNVGEKTTAAMRDHIAAADDLMQKAKQPRNPKVNVTIKRVEVVADDADRFIHSLNRAVGKELASPSQSVFMPRGNI